MGLYRARRYMFQWIPLLFITFFNSFDSYSPMMSYPQSFPQHAIIICNSKSLHTQKAKSDSVIVNVHFAVISSGKQIGKWELNECNVHAAVRSFLTTKFFDQIQSCFVLCTVENCLFHQCCKLTLSVNRLFHKDYAYN